MGGSPHKIVVGGSRSGKTYLVKNKLLPDALSTSQSLLVFDSETEFKDVANYSTSNLSEFDKAASKAQLVAYEPVTPPETEERGKEVDRFLEVADKHRPCIVVLEEAHENMASHPMKVLSRNLHKAVKKGAKYGMSLVFVSQEPNDILKSFWNNVGEVVVFRLKMDLDHWSLDYSPTELPQYHYIRSTDNVYESDKLCKPL